MPGRAFIQGFLRQAVKSGCEYALVEVTSQGVLQHRHRFIKWDAALFTNLAPEHIEAHGSFEKYREAKLGFFRYVRNFKSQILNLKSQKLFFVNQDDSIKPILYWLKLDIKIVKLFYSQKSSKYLIPNSKFYFFPENIAAAVAFAESRGLKKELSRKRLIIFPAFPAGWK